MDYREKYVYVSAHRDLADWLKGKLTKAGATVQDEVTSYTSYILEPRQNVIKKDERTSKNCQAISDKASEFDVPYLPLEHVASELLDDAFNPTWVCNAPSVLTEHRISSQVLIPRDAGYQDYEKLVQGANSFGMHPKARYRRGVGYVVVPKILNESNVEWMRTILRKANTDSLYLLREDIFLKTVANKGGEKGTPFTEKSVATANSDTDYRQKLVEEMKATLHKCQKKFPKEFVVMDTEYKRFPDRPFENLITEIGLIHVKDGKIMRTYDTLVKNEGIDPHDQYKYREDSTTPVKKIREIKPEVMNMIGGLPIVGHGIRKDMYLLGRAFATAFKNAFVDTQDMAKRYIYDTDSYKLEDLSVKYGFQQVDHRALGDCYTTLQLYNKIQTLANQ